jgi:hypothetical protein
MGLWMVLGMGLAQVAQRSADEARFRTGAAADRVAPHAPTLKLASLGQETMLADLIWVRTVLAFADIHDAPTPNDVQWVGAMVDAVAKLDGRWRTVYFYGGSFLRVLGDIDHSDKIFEAGHAAIPEDSFFPFALGMNAFLYRQDVKVAFRWIATAAELPNAPNWYRAAAAGFVEEGGDRRAALRYLEEEMRADQKPRVREALLVKYNTLLHDELVDQIDDHRQSYQARFQQDIQAIGELGQLPEDPLGGEWILAPDGRIRSSKREDLLCRKAILDERSMVLLPVGQRPY